MCPDELVCCMTMRFMNYLSCLKTKERKEAREKTC
jgi:hypothetical protein